MPHPKHALVSQTEKLEQGFINASALLYAQKLMKKELSKEADQRVYKAFCAKYYQGVISSDTRAKYEQEIADLATNDPKGLEIKLGSIFKELAAAASKRAADSNPYRPLVNLAAELGFEPEIYLENGDGKPFNFYPFLGLKKKQFNFGKNPHKLALFVPSMSDVRVSAVEFPVENEADALALRRHNSLMQRPRPSMKRSTEDATEHSKDTTAEASKTTSSAYTSRAQSMFPGLDTFGQFLDPIAKMMGLNGIFGKLFGFIGKAMQFIKQIFSGFMSPATATPTAQSAEPEMTASVPSSHRSSQSEPSATTLSFIQRMADVNKGFAASTVSEMSPASAASTSRQSTSSLPKPEPKPVSPSAATETQTQTSPVSPTGSLPGGAAGDISAACTFVWNAFGKVTDAFGALRKANAAAQQTATAQAAKPAKTA